MSENTSNTPSDLAFLQLLAERATSNPAYVGWGLREYSASEGETLAHLMSRLGVAEGERAHLMVSLRPTSDRFAEMIGVIAARFRVDELALASVLRHVEVLETLRRAQNASADAGVLLAARMRNRGTEREAAAGAEQSAQGGIRGIDPRSGIADAIGNGDRDDES